MYRAGIKGQLEAKGQGSPSRAKGLGMGSSYDGPFLAEERNIRM
jgi:hypothetical protein